MEKTFCKTLGVKATTSQSASLPAARASAGKRFARAVFCSLVTLAMATPGASHAGQIWNGWNYAIDSSSDGSGGSGYEELSLAYHQQGSTGYFAISGGMPLAGVPHSGVLNETIAPGELYLNFSSHNLDTQAKYSDPDVFAIRFTSANDSLGNVSGSNPTLGLFKNLTVTNLTGAPYGYTSLQQYYDYGFGRTVGAMGDLNTTTDVTNYFGNGTMYPNVATGTFVEGISSLDAIQLAALGLDFAHFPGALGGEVYGFSFDRSKLPTGAFRAHFFEECINDGIALNVPEPGTLALLSLSLAGIAFRRRRQ